MKQTNNSCSLGFIETFNAELRSSFPLCPCNSINNSTWTPDDLYNKQKIMWWCSIWWWVMFIYKALHIIQPVQEKHIYYLKKCVRKAFHNICNDYLMLWGEFKWFPCCQCHANRSMMRLRAAAWAAEVGGWSADRQADCCSCDTDNCKMTSYSYSARKKQKALVMQKFLIHWICAVGWRKGRSSRRDGGIWNKMYYSHIHQRQCKNFTVWPDTTAQG